LIGGVFSIGVGLLVADIGVGVGTDCAIFGITVVVLVLIVVGYRLLFGFALSGLSVTGVDGISLRSLELVLVLLMVMPMVLVALLLVLVLGLFQMVFAAELA
jgi:hypothetical protein